MRWVLWSIIAWCDNGVLDQDLVVPVMKELQKRFDGKIKSASFDRAFHTPENQKTWPRSCGRRVSPRKDRRKGVNNKRREPWPFAKRAASSGRRVGDRRLAGRQWPEALSGSQQAGLRALRGPGHLGPQSANLGQAAAGPGRRDCQAAKSKRKTVNRPPREPSGNPAARRRVPRDPMKGTWLRNTKHDVSVRADVTSSKLVAN